MGLRWDAATHAWHGRLLAAQRAILVGDGLTAKVVVPIEAVEPAQAAPTLPPVRPRPPSDPRSPSRHHSRTRSQSRLAFPGADGDDVEDAEEITATPTRRCSPLEVTNGLPDDSREADEREEARRPRNLRARVKAARALVSATTGLSETLPSDWQKATMFYAGFGVSELQFRKGVPEADSHIGTTPVVERARTVTST